MKNETKLYTVKLEWFDAESYRTSGRRGQKISVARVSTKDQAFAEQLARMMECMYSEGGASHSRNWKIDDTTRIVSISTKYRGDMSGSTVTITETSL